MFHKIQCVLPRHSLCDYVRPFINYEIKAIRFTSAYFWNALLFCLFTLPLKLERISKGGEVVYVGVDGAG